MVPLGFYLLHIVCHLVLKLLTLKTWAINTFKHSNFFVLFYLTHITHDVSVESKAKITIGVNGALVVSVQSFDSKYWMSCLKQPVFYSTTSILDDFLPPFPPSHDDEIKNDR